MRLGLALTLFFSLAAVTRSAPAANAIVNPSSTNTPSDYSTNPGSLVLKGLDHDKNFGVINGTTCRLCFYIQSTSDTTAPVASAVAGQEHCIPAGSYRTWYFLPMYQRIYMRSDTGSACSNSAVVDLDTW